MQWHSAQCHRSCLWLTDFFFRRLNSLLAVWRKWRTTDEKFAHFHSSSSARDSLPLFFCHLWKIRKSFFFISICSSLHSTTTFTQSLCDDDLSPGHIIGTLRESSYLCQGRPHATCDDFFFHTHFEWVTRWLARKKTYYFVRFVHCA